ncbi:MAG TPA: hypothetical protein VHH36_09120 [Candidatus Thermoplasmatota archaeon]|nr:hypothetical protein [Candidatus Thermoplasmatota archaeon]
MQIRVVLLAIALAWTSSTATAARADGNPCTETNPSGGVGSAEANCTLHCQALDILGIQATSADGTWVSVTGSVTCGGATAICPNMDGPTCAGVSPRPTDSEGRGNCHAESDDWITDTITVMCFTTRPDATCGALDVPILCRGDSPPEDRNGTSSPCVGIQHDVLRDRFVTGAIACGIWIANNPLDLTLVEADSFVVMTIGPGSASAIVCNDGSCVPVEPSCSLNPAFPVRGFDCKVGG